MHQNLNQTTSNHHPEGGEPLGFPMARLSSAGGGCRLNVPSQAAGRSRYDGLAAMTWWIPKAKSS